MAVLNSAYKYGNNLQYLNYYIILKRSNVNIVNIYIFLIQIKI